MTISGIASNRVRRVSFPTTMIVKSLYCLSNLTLSSRHCLHLNRTNAMPREGQSAAPRRCSTLFHACHWTPTLTGESLVLFNSKLFLEKDDTDMLPICTDIRDVQSTYRHMWGRRRV